MVIEGLGTASPDTRYTQEQCWEALRQSRQFNNLTSRSRAILKKVLTSNNGIRTRHLALDGLAEAFQLTPDVLQTRFAAHAPKLASLAALRALADARLAPEQVDALIISTCTGYLCPGLTSYVGEQLGLRPDVVALDLVGQGCAAALPNLRTAEALLRSGRVRRVLSASVEICTAALYLDDDPGVLISACLFGDGAGAAVLSLEPNGNRLLAWKRCDSLLDPRSRDLLRFEHKHGMLRNVLSPAVPELAARSAQGVLARALAAAEVPREQVRAWIFHPGGRDVLQALQRRIGLPAAELRWSRGVLEEYGNLSSASVFFVLQAALRDHAPPGYWWMSSFGAGFSCHGALLEAA